MLHGTRGPEVIAATKNEPTTSLRARSLGGTPATPTPLPRHRHTPTTAMKRRTVTDAGLDDSSAGGDAYVEKRSRQEMLTDCPLVEIL